MSYSGIFNDKLTGLYRSKNLMEGDYCVATFFEPTYARACLPCWDEPAIKAVFDISVIADHKYTVLSNMNEISSEDWDQDSSKKVVKLIFSHVIHVIIYYYFCDFIEMKRANVRDYAFVRRVLEKRTSVNYKFVESFACIQMRMRNFVYA